MDPMNTIDTMPPASSERKASEEVFDSKDGLAAKPQFVSSTAPLQRPRKPTRKLPSQDTPPFPSPVDTDPPCTVPSMSPNAGRMGGGLPTSRKRPSSDIITDEDKKLLAAMPQDKLIDDLLYADVEKRRLEKIIETLQRAAEEDREAREQLTAKLDLADIASNNMARGNFKTQEILTTVEKDRAGLVEANQKLTENNIDLKRQIFKSQVGKRDCEVLNATQANQMQELTEQVFRKTKLINGLNGRLEKLETDRDAAMKETQRLAANENDNEFQDQISALETALEAARQQIQEQEGDINAAKAQIAKFEQQHDCLEDELTIIEHKEGLHPGTSTSETALEAAEKQIQKQQADLVAKERRLVELQVLLEDKYFQEDGAKTASPQFVSRVGSPRRPERRGAMDQVLLEPRLSDTPGLTDDASTRSTASLASTSIIAGPRLIDPAGPSDLPDTKQPKLSDAAVQTDDASTRSTTAIANPESIDSASPSDLPIPKREVVSNIDPLEGSGHGVHQIFFQLPSEDDGKPYTIVGGRPRDAGNQDSGFQWEVASQETRNSSVQTDAPFLTTRHLATQTDTPSHADLSPRSKPPRVAMAAQWPLLQCMMALFICLLFSISVVYEERRIWGGANELSRQAVVSMKNDWWGSPWAGMIQFGLDPRGFC